MGDTYAHALCTGAANTGCYLSTTGAGGYIFSNGLGTTVSILGSASGTSGDSLLIRTASTSNAHPVIVQSAGGKSVAIAGGNVGPTATAGFMMIPYSAGAPTGTPIVIAQTVFV